MPAKSYISRYVVLWCMYMWLFCNFIYLCVYVRLLWPAAIPSAVTLVIKSSVPMNSSVPAQTLRSRFLPAYTQQQQPQQWVTTAAAAAAARRVLSFQDWVRGESKADVSVREHAAAQQTGDEMAAESSAVRVAPLTQSKEFVPPCSHRDMLNRRCSTAGTQAYWINKRRRSKDDCCVCVWANRQRAGRCSFLLPSVAHDLRPKKRDFMCSLKKKKYYVKVLQENGSATKIQIDSQVF